METPRVNFIQITPFTHVTNLEKALAFFTDIGPVNQSCGQRELLVLAPDGNLIAFGQAIKKRNSARTCPRAS